MLHIFKGQPCIYCIFCLQDRSTRPCPREKCHGQFGRARPSPHLENILHALIDELHVDDVQQGGCWQHLPPETQGMGLAPQVLLALHASEEPSVQDVSGAAGVRPCGL